MGSSVNGCPKCGGMLVVDRYLGQWYEDCIQCGYLRFLEKHLAEAHPEPIGKDTDLVDWLGELSQGPTPRQRQSGRRRPR